MLRLFLHKDANIFENHFKQIMLVFIGKLSKCELVGKTISGEHHRLVNRESTVELVFLQAFHFGYFRDPHDSTK